MSYKNDVIGKMTNLFGESIIPKDGGSSIGFLFTMRNNNNGKGKSLGSDCELASWWSDYNIGLKIGQKKSVTVMLMT